MRVALFVEGSYSPSTRGVDRFQEIWTRHVPDVLGCDIVSRVVPISKKDLVAMEPGTPRSGSAIPLDIRMARELNHSAFDIAVIVWDLVPAWNPGQAMCRWNETKKIYEGIARSTVLPELWRLKANHRLADYEARTQPNMRNGLQPFEEGQTMVVCIENTFESILLLCESEIRRVLGAANRNVRNWPTWQLDAHRPDTEVLQLAIQSARALNPRAQIFRQIRGDMYTAKNDWGEFLLRSLLANPECKNRLVEHSAFVRLRELLKR